MEQQLS